MKKIVFFYLFILPIFSCLDNSNEKAIEYMERFKLELEEIYQFENTLIESIYERDSILFTKTFNELNNTIDSFLLNKTTFYGDSTLIKNYFNTLHQYKNVVNKYVIVSNIEFLDDTLYTKELQIESNLIIDTIDYKLNLIDKAFLDSSKYFAKKYQIQITD